MKAGTLIEVVWIDANSPRDTKWELVEDFRLDSPTMEILSCGYFVEKRDGYIRMVGDRSCTDEFEEVVNRVFNIPLGCVRKIHQFKRK